MSKTTIFLKYRSTFFVRVCQTPTKSDLHLRFKRLEFWQKAIYGGTLEAPLRESKICANEEFQPSLAKALLVFLKVANFFTNSSGTW